MAVDQIEGIGPANAKKLAKAGVRSVNGLLKSGATSKGRRALAEASGVNEKQILDWVNMADLFRISGVSTQYAELLKCTGVDTVKELANRNPDNLHKAMVDTNAGKKLVRQLPGADKVKNWVTQAKKMPRVVSY